MQRREIFTHTDSDLIEVFEELRRLEPIFHTSELGTKLADFDRRMTPEYWEVGASGHRYSRDFILDHVQAHPPVDAEAAGWKTSDHAVRGLGADTYLFTYTLDQGGRVTRRTTVWRNTAQGWEILYHQGTVYSANEKEALAGSPDGGPKG